jgi:hypothetical protein
VIHLLKSGDTNGLALGIIQRLGKELKQVAQVLQKDFGNCLKQGVQAVNTDFTMSGVGAVTALVQELQQVLPFSFGYIDSCNCRNNSSCSMEHQVSIGWM